jgi:hypothetical protein
MKMETDARTSSSLIRNPDVVLREEDADGALLFNPETNQIRVLNTTGLFIWNLLDGSRDIAAIVNSIKDSFEDVPENEVEEHTRAFIADMKASEFVQEA